MRTKNGNNYRLIDSFSIHRVSNAVFAFEFQSKFQKFLITYFDNSWNQRSCAHKACCSIRSSTEWKMFDFLFFRLVVDSFCKWSFVWTARRWQAALLLNNCLIEKSNGMIVSYSRVCRRFRLFRRIVVVDWARCIAMLHILARTEEFFTLTWWIRHSLMLSRYTLKYSRYLDDLNKRWKHIVKNEIWIH